MSRIGKNPITIPEGTKINIQNNCCNVSGKLGELSFVFPEKLVEVQYDNEQIYVKAKSNDNASRASWGMVRSCINNLVYGVNNGFSKNLEMRGVGYKAIVKEGTLHLSCGFSHDILYSIPKGIEVTVTDSNKICIAGIDKQAVGQVASNIYNYRKPEPYKGKGIRYVGQYVRMKDGKKK